VSPARPLQLRVERLAGDDLAVLGPLLAQSLAEGQGLVQRIVDDWAAGANRFEGPGEALFVARYGYEGVGVCGVNVDPFAGDPRLARLRHLYVHPALRRRGVARGLVERCLAHAAGRFERIRLRTGDPDASRFYVALGFRLCDEPDATHTLAL
jgi:GNAT superfamily N-acetyltransferase